MSNNPFASRDEEVAYGVGYLISSIVLGLVLLVLGIAAVGGAGWAALILGSFAIFKAIVHFIKAPTELP